MRPNLTKPLVVFDLETTGLDISKDRIIQISYIKIMPDGSETRQAYFINPERRIPKTVEDLTHITNEMVASAPTFKELAPALSGEFKGCDFAGYNSNHFDIPLLAEEFIRAGVDFDFSRARLIDAMNIFRKMEKRNLAAAYEFYCGRKMEEDFRAHRADEDTEATWRVLQGQLDMYSPERQTEPERILPNDMNYLHEISNPGNNIDFAGRLIWKTVTDKDGNVVADKAGQPLMREAFNFGKYKDQFVADVLTRDTGYYSWVMGADFPRNTKQALTRIRLKYLIK
ncbi:MAG: 3'-5' exonuclease [Prevotella sp.]|nr:3'-5' exonuclease [Prevotella sp.]